jgi:membrane protease YdiL (CAAX protease family)
MSGVPAAEPRGARMSRSLQPSLGVIVGAYCALIVAAEAAGAAFGAIAGAVLDAVALVALMDHYVVGSRDDRATRLFPALALVPLMRLASLALALRSPIAFYFAAGTPVLLATVLAARELDLDPLLRLGDLRLRAQWVPALAAVPLGALAAHLLKLHHPLEHGASMGRVLAASAVVFAFGGVLEELLFRGVIQRALERLGLPAIAIANLLFGATYLATGSVAAVVAAAVGGALAGWWARRTGSVAGVAAAHGLLAAGYLVLWPALLR